MKKFEIVKIDREIKSSDKIKIETGCTLYQTNSNHEILESFDTEEEGRKRFKNYESIIEDLGSYYLITEFYLEENDYNENGYIIDGNILEITEILLSLYICHVNKIKKEG